MGPSLGPSQTQDSRKSGFRAPHNQSSHAVACKSRDGDNSEALVGVWDMVWDKDIEWAFTTLNHLPTVRWLLLTDVRRSVREIT